jgi:cysteine desulfurase
VSVTAYLDHSATTPLRPEALEAMMPFLTDRFGNPSGLHGVARSARDAVESCRERVAEALGAQPGEVVFTSGGTESDNLAIFGVPSRAGGRVVCCGAEHNAVLNPVRALGGTVVATAPDGTIDLDALAGHLGPDVSLVSVMLANNEVGAITDLDAVADLVAERAPNAVLHTDAVQAFQWLDVAERARRADLVSVSAHKFGGPKGAGALVVRDGVKLGPILHGGGHERERRSGTHNVAAIAGLAAAADATVASRAETVARVGALRDRLAEGLVSSVDGVTETIPRDRKVAGSCHVRFDGLESEALLLLLDDLGVCASAGSACASGAIEPSHVLTAMGLSREQARASLRLSLGWASTDADIDVALKVIPDAVDRLRNS